MSFGDWKEVHGKAIWGALPLWRKDHIQPNSCTVQGGPSCTSIWREIKRLLVFYLISIGALS